MIRALLLVAMLLPSLARAAVGGDCTWAEPGRNPYTGGAARALASFGHIPKSSRAGLLVQIAAGRPDDVVQIRRDSIKGSPSMRYDPGIYDMHFAGGLRCGNVSRAGWLDDQAEVADVYRTGQWCVIRPRVCGNWFWTVCDAMPIPAKAGAMSVPEPGALALVGLALAVLAITRGRRVVAA